MHYTCSIVLKRNIQMFIVSNRKNNFIDFEVNETSTPQSFTITVLYSN